MPTGNAGAKLIQRKKCKCKNEFLFSFLCRTIFALFFAEIGKKDCRFLEGQNMPGACMINVNPHLNLATSPGLKSSVNRLYLNQVRTAEQSARA